jgi:hypothetical protein
VRGIADPSSDFDLYVLHDGSFRQRVQRWFQAVPFEVFVNPEAAVLEYIRSESREGRPVTAHMLATGVVLWSADDSRLEKLIRHARASLSEAPVWSQLDLTRDRHAAATLVEDATDRWPADPVSAVRLLGMAMEASLTYWFRKRGAHHPRQREVISEIERLNPELGGHLRRFWGDSPVAVRWDAGMAAVDHVLGTRGFFEWESEQDPFPKS